MKGLIIYKGKYGATAQYANWLGKDLGLPVVQPEDVSPEVLSEYDYVIVGSSVYIGKLQIKDWIRQFEDILAMSKVYFFIVCGTPLDEKEKLTEIVNANIPDLLKKENNIFFLRGRLVKKNLSFMDRFMLKVGAMLQKDKETGQRMLQDFDEVKRENLKPLILKMAATKVSALESIINR